MPGDLEKLQGVWTVSGQSQIILRKTKFESTSMGATYEGEIQIDESKKPKIFDLVFTSGPEKGNRNLGIYKLDGDAWTICLATRGDKRPGRFASKPDDGIALQTLTRGAAAKQQSKATTKRSITTAVGSGPPSELEGEWQMLSAVFNGAAMDESMTKWCKRITNGNVTTVMAGPQVMLKASFTLNESKRTPRNIDYVNLAGASKGKAQSGIYDLREGTLRICMAAPGTDRPTEFESKPGDGRSLTLWRRSEGTL